MSNQQHDDFGHSLGHHQEPTYGKVRSQKLYEIHLNIPPQQANPTHSATSNGLHALPRMNYHLH